MNALYLEFVNRVNEVGVDINQCITFPHTASLLQFVCGLGPRKASYLLKVSPTSSRSVLLPPQGLSMYLLKVCFSTFSRSVLLPPQGLSMYLLKVCFSTSSRSVLPPPQGLSYLKVSPPTSSRSVHVPPQGVFFYLLKVCPT